MANFALVFKHLVAEPPAIKTMRTSSRNILKKMAARLLLGLFGLLPSMAWGQQQVLEIAPPNFPGDIDLDAYTTHWIDSSATATYEFAQNQHFTPLPPGRDSRKTSSFGIHYWYQLRLKNGTDTIPFSAVITCQPMERLTVWLSEDGQPPTLLRAGTTTHYHHRAYATNQFAFPVSIRPGRVLRILVMMEDDVKKTGDFPGLRLKSFEQERLGSLAEHENWRPKHFYIFFFLGALVLLALLSGFQWLHSRDDAFLAYLAYLLGMFLFYLKTFERINDTPLLFSWVMGWQYYIEPYHGYFILLAYTAFVHRFLLDEGQQSVFRSKAKPLLWVLCLLLVCITFVQVRYGDFSGLRAYYLSYLVVMPLSLYCLWQIFRSSGEARLKRYILAGTCLLLLGVLSTTFRQVFQLEMRYALGGTIRVFHTAAGTPYFYMYDIKIGILLEFVCFLFGLSYRQKILAQSSQPAAVPSGQALPAQALRSAPAPEPVAIQPSPAERAPTNGSGNGNHHKTGEKFLQDLQAFALAGLSSEQFGVEELSRFANLERSAFYRKFREMTGEAPSDWLRRLRLERAQALLTGTEKSIAEIAEETGFGSLSAFSRAIKAYFGRSPSEMRKPQ